MRSGHRRYRALAAAVLVLGPALSAHASVAQARPLPEPMPSSGSPTSPTSPTSPALDPVPETGGTVWFNNPLGSRAQQYAVVDRIDAAIASARPGSVLRLAAYSLAMRSTTRALLAAHRRGVQVRVVVDDHSAHWGPAKALAPVLGTDIRADSYLRICRLSCRGGKGVQHGKLLTVSSSTLGEGLVLAGSQNLTRYGATRQWNDLYEVADLEVHDELARWFDLMTLDRPQGRLRMPVTGSGFEVDTSPYPGISRAEDPLVQRLRAVRCRAAAPGTGRAGRTVVRISMHAWNGERGIVLARLVVGLHRAGCDVKVLYGVGTGRVVERLLRAGHVPVRDSVHDGRRVHHKVMILSGAIGERTDAQYVWTGSHNWSDRSLRNDELMLRVSGPALVDAYLADFARIWALARS